MGTSTKSHPNSLIEKTFNLFSSSKKRNLKKTYIFTCQHILRPREKMFSLLVDFGIPRKNIFILGKTYSTNNKLFLELQKLGFNIYNLPFDIKKPFDDQHQENCKQLFDLFERIVPNGSRVILLDDGGMLLSVFNENFKKISNQVEIFGIEQTSSGYRKLEGQTLKFPIVNVARSTVKLNKETPFIIKSCLENLFYQLRKKNIIHNNRFLVVGLGKIGHALVDALKKQGEKVYGFDTFLGHKDLVEKIKKSRINIIIGATGTASVSRDEIECLKNSGYPIYFASVSSSDREFPVANYRKSNNLGVHSDIKYGNITFFNNGFPINFSAINLNGEAAKKEGIKKIEKTICLLLGSILYLANCQQTAQLTNGFLKVPKKITVIL